jgi:hypothetical protein
MEPITPHLKIIDIPRGRLMVVTDLHGNWDDYLQAWRVFTELHELGEVDKLIFLGDLVHNRNPKRDESIRILDDLIRRGANQPESLCLALIGNHEMVHIYHIEMWRGADCYSEPFERAIRGRREHYIRFLMDMPIAVRTEGGTLLNHAGPSGIVGLGREKAYNVTFDLLREWPHEEQLAKCRKRAKLPKSFDPLNNFDPRIGLAFVKKKKGIFFWELLMNKNENRYHEHYRSILERFMRFMAQGRERPLTVMVNGHLQVPKGLRIVDPLQLRLSSGFGAKSDRYKTYVVVDAEKTYADAADLATKCRAMYQPE